jgi:hypothetical protein
MIVKFTLEIVIYWQVSALFPNNYDLELLPPMVATTNHKTARLTITEPHRCGLGFLNDDGKGKEQHVKRQN